jgi:hypothetical protein
MNAAYLQRAGPRLPEAQLLDHYHSHTERCSVCQPALRNVRLARAAAGVVGVAAAALAAMALLIQYAAGAGVLSSAAQPALAAAGQAMQQAAAQQPAAGLPSLVRLAGWAGVVAAVAFPVWLGCHKTIPRFFSGERPHARNCVPGEWAA